jgi:predicted DNA-binding protein
MELYQPYLPAIYCDMTTRAHRNLHVPLPGSLHDRLRAVAMRSKRPTTSVAREAIEAWVDERERQAVHEAIAAYATEMAGTAADLDEGLERAAIEHLRGRRRKR